MNAAGVLAGGEEPFDRGAAVGVHHDAPHHEVRGRPDLDGAARQVAPEIPAPAHHAAEVALDDVSAEVRDVDPHATVGRPAALDHLEERCP